MSSFYIILILLYIKFIYNDDNYDSLMMYFITLAVGRFIYFDFTMDDFLSTIHGFWEELPLLILMTSYSGFICWFGFHIGFLLTFQRRDRQHTPGASVYGLFDFYFG